MTLTCGGRVSATDAESISLAVLKDALAFYEQSPDGYYDDVAYVLIQAAIEARVTPSGYTPEEWAAVEAHIDRNYS